MKLFKKVILVFIMLVGSFFLTGCGNVEGSLEDIMTKLYAKIPENERPMMLMNTEVDKESAEYYLGSSDIELKEAWASEPAVGSIAHSVVLVRVKKGGNVEAIKDKIEKSINPRKWVCVGVERDDIIVENKGDLIALIMVEDEKTREKIEEAFEKLR